MRMTGASLCNFMKKIPWAWYEAFVIVAETEGVPRQRIRKWCHDNISVPVTRLRSRCERKCDGSVTCDRMWGALEYRVPTCRWQGKRGATLSNKGASRTTCIHLRASSRGYTFEACVVGADQVRCGVGEVDVLGTFIVEVGVHGDGRGTRFSVDVRVIVEVLGVFGLVGLVLLTVVKLEVLGS